MFATLEDLKTNLSSNIDYYAAAARQLARSTAPADEEEVTTLVAELYKSVGHDAPGMIVWADNPKHLSRIAAVLEQLEDDTPPDVVLDKIAVVHDSGDQTSAVKVHLQTYPGQPIAIELSAQSYMEAHRPELHKEATELLPLAKLARHASMGYFTLPVAVLARKINCYETKQQGDKSIEFYRYAGGYGLAIVDDHIFDADVVDRLLSGEVSESLRALILDEENQEKKRVMIELLGEANFLGDVEPTHTDEYGALYRIDNDYQLVRVENSTLEDNGSRRVFFLPVAGGIETAGEAVASTFGMTLDEYKEIQSHT